jgi:hypothetical protein
MAKRKRPSTPETVKARKATSKRRQAAKRELIDTGTDKRYVKRRADGTFKESGDVSRSLRADRAQSEDNCEIRIRRSRQSAEKETITGRRSG